MSNNTILEYFVPMPDGTKLYTIVQLPEKGEKFPVIIHRNPYFSCDINFEELKSEETFGYAVVTQHCRGTGKSEGVFHAYTNERNDGLALLDWIRQQSFYNGEIFLNGASYAASVHYAYLDTNPKDIKAAFLGVQDPNRYNICYRNGFLKPGLHGNWVLKMYKKNQPIERNFTIDTFRTLPLANITKSVFNEYVPSIENTFIHPDSNDEYWKTIEGGSDYINACSNSSMPILFTTSFYDIYTGGILDMWKNLSCERKKNCALVVTPFEHNYNPLETDIKEELQDFKDGLLRKVCPNLMYDWFDSVRENKAAPFVEMGKIIYYRLYDNKWIKTPELKNNSCEQILYLSKDRTLEPTPSKEDTITYTYNPYNPANFNGGVCYNFGGVAYQDAPNSRYDIISFMSKEFTKDAIIEGEIQVELHCKSTAPDTCFYLRLSLVRDNKAISLRDDIDSLCRVEKEYIPGEERVLKFTLVYHAFKMLKGDALRLDVSSSCVPHFQVHTNNKGIQALQTSAQICKNTIITGKSFIKYFQVEDVN